MKILNIVLLIIMSLQVHAEIELPCSASINGEAIQLERTASGLLMVAIEDPHFDEYDVVIDLTKPKSIKARLAKFIPTPLVNELKSEISKLSESMQNEIIKLAKARVIDGVMGFDILGQASLTLIQGNDQLFLRCSDN